MTPLVDHLLEEVLLRLLPQEPASLVCAALVCRRWRRLLSAAGFRRRFREFHHSLPMLGMLCNRNDIHVARFVPTAAFCSPEADRGCWRALDARHGRVLLQGKASDDLVVWDPITDEEWKLPFPPRCLDYLGWTAAVLCAVAAGAEAGACDHLDCHRRPFVVVLVAPGFVGPDIGKTFICTYASKTAAWSEPIISNKVPEYQFFSMGSVVLVGNALYFTEILGSRVLKYSLELQEISWIPLPSSFPLGWYHQSSVLIATENGELGFATEQGSKLCIWLRKQDACTVVGDKWHKPSGGIELKTLFPADVAMFKLDVVGSAEGVGIIFMRADDVIYMIDLKTCKVKEVYEGKIDNIIPYMSFYTPALEATCTCGKGPSVGGSSA